MPFKKEGEFHLLENSYTDPAVTHSGYAQEASAALTPDGKWALGMRYRLGDPTPPTEIYASREWFLTINNLSTGSYSQSESVPVAEAVGTYMQYRYHLIPAEGGKAYVVTDSYVTGSPGQMVVSEVELASGAVTKRLDYAIETGFLSCIYASGHLLVYYNSGFNWASDDYVMAELINTETWAHESIRNDPSTAGAGIPDHTAADYRSYFAASWDLDLGKFVLTSSEGLDPVRTLYGYTVSTGGDFTFLGELPTAVIGGAPGTQPSIGTHPEGGLFWSKGYPTSQFGRWNPEAGTATITAPPPVQVGAIPLSPPQIVAPSTFLITYYASDFSKVFIWRTPDMGDTWVLDLETGLTDLTAYYEYLASTPDDATDPDLLGNADVGASIGGYSNPVPEVGGNIHLIAVGSTAIVTWDSGDPGLSRSVVQLGGYRSGNRAAGVGRN